MTSFLSFLSFFDTFSFLRTFSSLIFTELQYTQLHYTLSSTPPLQTRGSLSCQHCPPDQILPTPNCQRYLSLSLFQPPSPIYLLGSRHLKSQASQSASLGHNLTYASPQHNWLLCRMPCMSRIGAICCFSSGHAYNQPPQECTVVDKYKGSYFI